MKKDSFKILNNLIRIIALVTAIIFIYYKNYEKATMSLITFILTFYDCIITKILKLEISNSNKLFIIIFIFLSQYLGSTFKFYSKFNWWDILLHFSSGILFFSIGLDIYKQIYKNNKVIPKLLFAILLALSIANIWEIMEYLADGILHLNTQRAGKLVGRLALKDTMTDLIVSTIGTFLAAIFSYFKLRKKA